VATIDGYLIALDAKSGAVIWRTDTFVDRVTMNYSSTGAPRIAGHNIVIGNSGAEMGARGYVTAYDLTSGKMSWRFFTVPGDPGKGPDESPDVSVARRTWSADSRWDLGGGGTVWDSMVYDPKLGLLYVGVGNACRIRYGRAAPAAATTTTCSCHRSCSRREHRPHALVLPNHPGTAGTIRRPRTWFWRT